MLTHKIVYDEIHNHDRRGVINDTQEFYCPVVTNTKKFFIVNRLISIYLIKRDEKKSKDKERFFNIESVENNLKSDSMRGGIFIMCGEAITLFLRIGSIAILARILIPEHFGLITMVTTITTIAERFKDLGLGIATIQQKKITHEEVSNLFWINMIAGFILMMIISMSSYFIAWFYNEERLIYITIAISTSFIWSSLTIQHQAILRRQMKFMTLSLILIGSAIINESTCFIFVNFFQDQQSQWDYSKYSIKTQGISLMGAEKLYI